MLKPCKSCGSMFDHKRRRAILCQPCKTAQHREYCKSTNYHRKRYKKIAPQERERHLIRKYGMTQADYDRMFSAQGGQCAICNKTQERALDVDHCHATGLVRGLLCTNCNRMIGHAGDRADKLRAAANYLELSIVPQVAAEVIKAYFKR